MPESLYEAGGRDEIQIMIQFDLHSRELKKNKMEHRKDKKKQKRVDRHCGKALCSLTCIQNTIWLQN